MTISSSEKDADVQMKGGVDGNNNNSNNNNIEAITETNNTYYGFKKNEVTKLIIQSLHDLGYESIAQKLENQSGLTIDTQQVRSFRTALLNGEWEKAEELLESITLLKNIKINDVKFSIRRQEFLESLSEADPNGALNILQKKLTPLNCNTTELHNLSKLVLYEPNDITKEYDWSLDKTVSRNQLANALEYYMSPDEVLPPHRLGNLLQQAKQYQINKTLYWMGDEDFSLYKDIETDKSNFPIKTAHVLEGHTDEVWHLTFSHHGHFLASTSRDHTIRIWDTNTWQVIRVLEGHTKGVVYAAWSPNDQMLISCGEDNAVLIWHVHEGACIKAPKLHNTTVSSACWVSDTEYITTSLDKRIVWCDMDDNIIFEWKHVRVVGAAITPNRELLIALSNENTMHFIDLIKRQEIKVFNFQNEISHVEVTKDSKYALVNSKPEELYLYNLQTLAVERKYIGNLHHKFIIRSCFGGMNENFIISGSHDEFIYVWDRQTAMLLEVLSGHSKPVNGVKWSPIDARMFVSASDDKTIRVWRS